MRKTLRLLIAMVLVTSTLSGCIVVPLWDGGWHHHGGWSGRR